MPIEIVKGYQEHEALRGQLNELARKTFGLNLEPWYQAGYWKDNYIPYSVLADGRLVANVSVSPMEFDCRGERRRFYQLGTVMSDIAYRRQGLVRRLMEAVDGDFGGKAKGSFLFANDSVLNFYPKFGYAPQKESVYYREVSFTGPAKAHKMTIETAEERRRLEEAIRSSACQSGFELLNNPQIILFKVMNFLRDCVYYLKEQDAWVIAEREGDTLSLLGIYCRQQLDPLEVAAAFGAGIGRVELGFVPLDPKGYARAERVEEDTTLFVRGEGLSKMMEEGILIPILSHT